MYLAQLITQCIIDLRLYNLFMFSIQIIKNFVCVIRFSAFSLLKSKKTYNGRCVHHDSGKKVDHQHLTGKDTTDDVNFHEIFNESRDF